MPKRVGYLYDKICEIDHLHAAFHNALRRKKSTPSAFTTKLLEHEDEVVEYIQFLLTEEMFEPSPPHCFKVVDGLSGKVRDVQAPEIYPDQLIHWAMMMVLDSVILKGMYSHCSGSIPGRGPHHVKRYLEKKLRSPNGATKYKFCLKMDIHHFFQSIDQDILCLQFRRKIKDPRMLEIIDRVIYSVNEGLPIGYYTSQWFSNFYLEDFDRFVKEKLKVDCYVRYVDDIVICGSNKRKLHKIREKISEYLWDYLKLELKENYQVFRVEERGIDICGFRIYHNRTGIRKAILSNIVKANRRVRNPATKHALASMISYCGYLDHTDTYIFARTNLTGSKKYFVKRYVALDKAGVDNEIALQKLKRNGLVCIDEPWDESEKAPSGAL